MLSFTFFVIAIVACSSIEGTEKKVHKDTSEGINRFHDASDHTPDEDGEMYLATYLQRYYDQYENLSPEDRKERFIKEIKKSIDQNLDEKVTVEELTKWALDKIEHEAYVLYKEHLNLTEIDTNNDGILSLDEVLTDFKAHQNTVNEDSEANLLERQIKKEEAKFQYADRNEDGYCDSEELPRLVMPEHFRDSNTLFVKQFLFDYDTNSDGIVTLKEFIGNSVNDPNFESEEQIQQYFEGFDKNEDGSLSTQEIEKAAQDYITLDEVKREIAAIFYLAEGKDKDNLTYDELAKVSEYLTDKNARLPLDADQTAPEDGDDQGEEGDDQGEDGDYQGEDGDGENTEDGHIEL